MATMLAAVVATLVAVSAPTVVRHVGPVASDGTLRDGMTVSHRYTGARCQSGSAETGTAYRCFTSQAPDNVYDPCWVSTTPDRVFCLDRPWRHEVVRLRVTDGYDDTDGFRHVRWPWGLRITADRRCLYVPNAVGIADGRPIHYYCNEHVALAGRLDRSGARWRMRAYRNTTPHGVQATYRFLGWKRVVVAWRGTASQHD